MLNYRFFSILCLLFHFIFVILQRLKRLKTPKNALKRNFEPFLQGWLEAFADASLLDGGKYLSMPENRR